MTIEKTLERMASALEAIAAGGGALVYTKDVPNEDPIPKKSKPKPDEKRIGTLDEADPDYTKEMVRSKLQELQKATTPAQAKSILKSHGASTIGNLPASKYKQVIDECDAKLAE